MKKTNKYLVIVMQGQEGKEKKATQCFYLRTATALFVSGYDYAYVLYVMYVRT